MASTYTNQFAMGGVMPAFGPWGEAKRVSVKLPTSVTYPKGTILGEVTGNNEVVTLTLATGSSLSGTYTVSFAGQTSAAIAYNASAATVQLAVEALGTVGTGNLAVTGTTPGSSGGTLVFTFRNQLGKANVSALTLGVGSLTGDSGSAFVVTTAGSSGNIGNNEMWGLVLTTSGTLGGTFTVTYGGVTSSAIAYNATPATVQTALQAMSSIGTGNILVYGNTPTTSGGGYLLVFAGTLAKTDAGTVTCSGSGLTGSGSAAAVTKICDGAAATGNLYAAYLNTATDGSGTAKAILEFDCATDSSGNITLGGASGGDDKQRTMLSVPAFIAGTFKTEDLNQVPGAGQITDTAVTDLGRLLEGTVVQGLLRVG